jgi:hypothetical protein
MTRRIQPLPLALAAALALGACAGRAPAPVAVVQPIDETMNCTAINVEVAHNTQRITELGQESGAKVAQNIAAGIGGAILILPLFLMDFQNAAGVETTALQNRNAYLAQLARQRCGSGPVQPGVYPEAPRT